MLLDEFLRNNHNENGNFYVLQPKRKDKWTHFSVKVINELIEQYGFDFYVIIYSSENDYYSIPFHYIRHLLTEGTKASGNRQNRWIASIDNHMLHIHTNPTKIDISAYHCHRPNETVSNVVEMNRDGRNKIIREIAARTGGGKFRKELLRNYEGKCAVTGCRIQEILEAAHIFPYKGAHTNIASNGLLLRSDIHTLFDLRLLSIDPKDMCVLFAPSISLDPYYAQFNGKNIFEPKIERHKPNRELLQDHYLSFKLKHLI